MDTDSLRLAWRWGMAGWLLLCSLGAARADDAPAAEHRTFELGVGVGAVQFPTYPGAEEVRKLLLPFPYILYHGPFLDVNRDQVRGKLLRNGRLSFEVDFGGQVQVKSADTQERAGMPDRDWLGEVGPAARYRAWNSDDDSVRIDAVLPVRAAISAQGLTLTHRGTVAEPRLEVHQFLYPDGDRLVLDGTLSAMFVDKGYAGYYYSVAPQYATLTRPAYDAPGGYDGWDLNLGVTWHHGDLVLGAFVAYFSLHGAAFQASPLVARANGFSLGCALSWILQRPE